MRLLYRVTDFPGGSPADAADELVVTDQVINYTLASLSGPHGYAELNVLKVEEVY